MAMFFRLFRNFFRLFRSLQYRDLMARKRQVQVSAAQLRSRNQMLAGAARMEQLQKEMLEAQTRALNSDRTVGGHDFAAQTSSSLGNYSFHLFCLLSSSFVFRF